MPELKEFLLPFWYLISPFIIACLFCRDSIIMVNVLKHEGTKHPLIIVYLTVNNNFPRWRGIVNLSTNLASLESALKVKCFMFRNSWADCCCSSSHLIVCSDFSSSSETDETTPANLQNETTEVVCFLVSLRPRSHNAGGILNRRFHAQNASNVFRPHYAEGI